MKRLKTKGVPLRVAGAMSGTSLDGVDVAVLETDGVSITGFRETAYRPYTEAERKVLQAALGQWEGADVDAATAVIQAAHEEVLGGIGPVELVGFHGQTLAHAPRSRGTLQVGDGQALADKLGVPVVWDFRTADVKLGGEGAPLAPFYHWACARWAGLEQPVAFLNLGGVGNLTWLDPSAETPDKPGALVAFDTGPANAPINDMVQTCFGQAFDKGGSIAASGLVDDTAVQRFLAEKYFSKMPPKSLDRNDFPGIFDLVTQLSDNDAVATLTAMCAAAVAVGVSHCPQQPASVYVTGGGRHNPVLMAMLDARLPCSVLPVEAIGLDGDMLEAQAFAYLALRVVRGMTTSCPTTTGVSAAVGGGSVNAPGT